MDTEIGNLSVRIDADTSGLDRGTRHGEKRLDQFGGSMKRTTAIARQLTGVLGAIGIGVGFAQAIRELSNFQAAMNGLAAVSGATAEQMAKLEQQSRSLGATSQFSAQQAGEAQRFLAQAGFEVNEILGATPGILQLATAGGLDLASAADIASNVLGGMRMEVDELNRVNDVLAATAARSNTSIEQLGQALSFAAPFAAGAGISIEELSAAIGVMSDAGIQASRAGTGMVGVIRQLSRITSTGEAVLARYGLSMEDVSIEARGLGPVLETLRAANLDTAAAIELFGSEAGAAAQVLVSDYKGAIEDATGEADRMAKQLDQGLGPAFKSLQSAISESVLQMGDSGLAGALENLVRTSTGVISVWNGMGDEWAEANDASDTLRMTVDGLAVAIQTMAAVAAGRGVQALGSYTAAKLAANGATLTLTGSITALRTAMMGVFGPVGLVLGGVTALGALGRSLDDSEEDARQFAKAIDDATESLSGFTETSLITQIAAVSVQLESAKQAAESLAQANTNLSRGTGILGGSIGEVVEQVDLIAQTGGRASQEVESLSMQLQALKNALDLVRGAGGSEDPDDPEDPPGKPGSGDEQERERLAKERERLREHLAQRLEMIRGSLMNEREQEIEHHANRMEELAEIREQELISEDEYRKMREEAELQHLERLKNMEKRTAEERASIEQKHANTVIGMRRDVVAQSAALLDMFAGESKAAAIASIALQKGLAIAQTIMNTQVAQMRAMAELGPIAGPPMAAKIGALGATSVGIIAAQGLAQAASAMKGNASSSLTGGGSGGGGSATRPEAPGGTAAAPIGGTLTVEGISSSALFSGDAVRELANELIEFQRRGGQVVIS